MQLAGPVRLRAPRMEGWRTWQTCLWPPLLSQSLRLTGLILTPCLAASWVVSLAQGLLGGLSNVLETLRGEGAPPPACRAVVHASLRYIDAELLNALMLRRDACSISAVKALQVCCRVRSSVRLRHVCSSFCRTDPGVTESAPQ